MGNLIIGSTGRFALAFRGALEGKSETSSISFNQLSSMVFNLSDFLKIRSIENVFWTIGPGTSRTATTSREIEALQKFRELIVRESIEISNFHYLSTGGSMYGTNPGIVDESGSLDPVGQHGQKKLECEKFIAKELSDFFNTINIYRIANAYSLDYFSHSLGLIDSLFCSLKTGNYVRINVDPNSLRQYGTYNDYTNYIITYFVDSILSRERVNVYNVASAEILSIREIVTVFEENFPGKLKIEWENGKQDTVILKSRFVMGNEYRWKSLREALSQSNKS